MLKVVLQNPRGQRGGHGRSFLLNGADDFSAADDFGGGKSGNFLREHEIDFQLRVGLQSFVGLEEHSGPADVFGCAYVPVLLAETAIAQRQMKLETLRAVGSNFPGTH